MLTQSVIRKAVVTFMQGIAAVVSAYLVKQYGMSQEAALMAGAFVALVSSVVYNVVRDYLLDKDIYELPDFEYEGDLLAPDDRDALIKAGDEVPDGFDVFNIVAEFPADGQAEEA